MAKKILQTDFEINNIGEAVNHIAAGVSYFDKNHKIIFRFVVGITAIGFILGLGYWSTLKTVNIKEIPLGMANTPFTLYAGEKEGFKVDSASGTIFYGGKEIGTIDKNYEIYKLDGKDQVIIHNRKTGKPYILELELK